MRRERFARLLRISLWAISLLTLPPRFAFAQEPPAQPVDPAYVGLVAAARKAAASAALRVATQENATLTQKREAAEDRAVQEAVTQLRKWLETATGPATELNLDGDGLLAEAGGLRQLGRALAVQQYVSLAGGRVGDALDYARDSLRLAYWIEAHSLLGSLTGFAIETQAIMQLGKHLDQLSVRDCGRLMNLAQEWNRAASPLAIALERERVAGLNRLRMTLPKDLSDTEAQKRMDAFARSINRVYEQVQKRLKTPYWEHTQDETPAPANPEDPGKVLAETLLPVFEKAADAYVRRQALAKMLGCHAAIRRHFWEVGTYPATLAELKLGEMATDPFTGKEFAYKAEGMKYTLESAGPERDGTRASLSLTPKP